MARLYIAEGDLKERYKPLNDRGPHIQGFLKSIEHTSGIAVNYEIMTGPTVSFTISNNQSITNEQRKKITGYIQGEFCDPKAIKKYGNPAENLPHRKVEARNPSLEARTMKLSLTNLETHDTQSHIGPYELRQFACPLCRNSWWRTVPKRKPVSRCRGTTCHAQRYDALPLDQEFGIGKYFCSNCDRDFYAHCEATQVLQCRKCHQQCRNPIIHPKWRKKTRKERTESPREGFQRRPAYSSFSRSPGRMPQQPTAEAEPNARAFNPSNPHDSTGTTISTCITQFDEQSEHELDYDDDIPDAIPYPRRFECSQCQNHYTVRARMSTTAVCRRCGHHNSPVGPSSFDHIQRTSTAHHNCDDCPEDGSMCPNMR